MCLKNKHALFLANKFILKTLFKYLNIDITVIVEIIKDLLVYGNIACFTYSEKKLETQMLSLAIIYGLSWPAAHLEAGLLSVTVLETLNAIHSKEKCGWVTNSR